MNPDVPTTGPAPQPTPADNWFQRRLHAIGAELHDMGTTLAPELHAAEQAAEAAAAEAWKNAAAGVRVLIGRNEAEWRANLTVALTAYFASLAPGTAPEAGAIAAIVIKVTFDLLDFIQGKLAAQAATPLQPIGPPLVPTTEAKP